MLHKATLGVVEEDGLKYMSLKLGVLRTVQMEFQQWVNWSVGPCQIAVELLLAKNAQGGQPGLPTGWDERPSLELLPA